MKALLDTLPPRYRNALVYVPLGIIGTFLGAFGVGWAAASVFPFPDWYVVATAVYPFVAGAFGFNLASANTPKPPAAPAP